MYKEYVQSLLGEKIEKVTEKDGKKEIPVKPVMKSYQKNKVVRKVEIEIENNKLENINNVDFSSSQQNENKINDENDENDAFCMLTDGALILVDNVLWKGTVLGQVNYSASNLIFLHLI